MTIEPNYDADMKLPDGKTCDGCVHRNRCFAFGFSKPGNTSCDFWPSRYRPLSFEVSSPGSQP